MMQPNSTLPSQNGPILTGTGYGGLLVLTGLIVTLIPVALARRPVESGRARHTPLHIPVEQTQSAILHPGRLFSPRETRRSRNYSLSLFR
ncbi:MAG TPA: hypothetical protein VKU00_25800 [Chthonomonadaceae bacterium]|nr:hypothetical protein [Chthonomonadaceae bacterium]